MDPADLIVLPRLRSDPDEVDLVHVDAAIELVASGGAARVRLVGMRQAASLASTALARAQVADVTFSVERHGATATLTFGPRLTRS
jgi:hypothetical protein